MKNKTIIRTATALAVACSAWLGCKRDEFNVSVKLNNPTNQWEDGSTAWQTNSPSRVMAIGPSAGKIGTNSHVILIGRGAEATDDYQLVIVFDDGQTLRQSLPRGKDVDMRPWY